VAQTICPRTFNVRAPRHNARLIASVAAAAILSATASTLFAGSIDGEKIGLQSESNFPNGVVMCMNRNPPDGTVITRSVRQASCGDQCESEVHIPAGHRMLICRGQAIPKGYMLEVLTTTPDCSCYGGNENAYVIKVDPGDL
jgi:hypothetical protein